jgi:hypothetical protein
MKNDNKLGTFENPIKCKGIQGEREYLNKLVTPNGEPINYNRIGSKHAVNGNMLDIYEINYQGLAKPFCIYFDMYSKGPKDKKAVDGLKLMVEFLKPRPWQKMSYIDKVKAKYLSDEKLQLTSQFYYVHAKAGALLAQGPYIYSVNDYFGYPEKKWDTDGLLKCSEQLVHSLHGITEKYPITVSSQNTAKQFLETFHYQVKPVKLKGKISLFQLTGKHRIIGDEIKLWFNLDK